MKKTTLLIVLCFWIISAVQISCSHNDLTKNPNYGEKTSELISIVENNPNIKSMLIKSIAQAKVVNPDRKTNPAQTLEGYYDFVTWAETCMPWSILPDIIMIFQKSAGFVLKAANNGQSYQHLLMGERYGLLTGSN